MKFAERIARRRGRPFHSAIVTSFAVEFAAVEEILLPQLMNSGATNILLMADERMAALALQHGMTMPVGVGTEYTLWSPPIGDGLFHPKIILQLGRDGGRAFVSSANATAAGIAGNVEVAFEVECGSDSSAEQAIIRSVWLYLDRLIGGEPSAARDALDWARARSPWLEGQENEVVQSLADGSAIAFLTGPSDPAIGSAFLEMVAEPVEHLIVVSPYWDADLKALRDLQARLAPRRSTLLIDALQHEFPADRLEANEFDIVDISEWRPRRFTHAKLIIAVTARHDHVLAGSANCTAAALGADGRRSTNGEACLYRRVDRGVATANLGLGTLLEAEPTPATALPPKTVSPDIPLRELEAGGAGVFEINAGDLIWTTPAHVPAHCTLELLDHMMEQTEERVAADVSPNVKRQFRLSRTVIDQSAFAIVRGGSFVSNIAPITNRSALRKRRREIATGGVAKALTQFAVGGDFGLWLHQALDELTRADWDDEKRRLVTAARQPRSRQEGSPDEHGPLSYDEFMTTRPDPRRGSQMHQNSLAGLHTDSVRGFLNSLIGVGSEAQTRRGRDDTWMNLGDEPGQEPRGSPKAEEDPPSLPPEQSSLDAEVDAAACRRKVGEYVKTLEDTSRSVGPIDVLRLRFFLTFLLYTARCPSCPRGLMAWSDELAWPRMAVRVLSAFFVGRQPPICRLGLSREYAEMPVDLLECWATIDWTLKAIEASVPQKRPNREFLTYVPRLRERIKALLILRPDDFQSESYRQVWDGLDQTIGHRLGLNLSRAAEAA